LVGGRIRRHRSEQRRQHRERAQQGERGARNSNISPVCVLIGFPVDALVGLSLSRAAGSRSDAASSMMRVGVC